MLIDLRRIAPSLSIYSSRVFGYLMLWAYLKQSVSLLGLWVAEAMNVTPKS